MKIIRSIQLAGKDNEELLPGFSTDFPYIATRAELDLYLDSSVPWHWHPTVELFYMASGTLEYTTPNDKRIFPTGSGGLVNSNVLHTSRVLPSGEAAVQLLHLFEPELLSGGHGTRIHEKYIRPLTAAPGIELIPLSPDDPAHAELLQMIRTAFDLDENSWGYEFTLRQQLTDIWLRLFALARPALPERHKTTPTDDKLKAMMLYIHAHYPEPISVEHLAREAYVSKRVCFRLFQDNLHMTPLEYMTGYRLRKACRRLTETDDSITEIAYQCGLGSTSYFGKLFREHYDCTPLQYRQKWHDRDKSKQD